MKVAILGCRGIPAKYGGFETFAEGLTLNLEDKDFEVTVSCEYESPDSRRESFNGAKLEYFPLKPPRNYILRKFYENFSDIYFLVKLSRSQDLIYFLGIEVGMFLFIPRILNRKSKVVVNVDGVMWKRTKFNLLERWLLKMNHDMAIVFADKVVVDSEEMKTYVDKRYSHKTTFLSYGVNVPQRALWNNGFPDKLKKLTGMDISPGNYFLVVARLEPENNIHIIVEAFKEAKLDIPLLIVGDFTSKSYEEEIKGNDTLSGVFFLGSVYDQEFLNMLRQNCTAYIHGHSVGGTNPSLLEATISRNIIIAHDNPFNGEVCGKSALYFKNTSDLIKKLSSVYKYPENHHDLKEQVYRRVLSAYSWSKITADYVQFLSQLQAQDEYPMKPLETKHDGRKA